MNRFLCLIVNVACLIIIVGCIKKRPEPVARKEVKKMSFDMKNIQKQLGDCGANNGGCARVDLKYPQIKGLSSAKAQKLINNSILRALMENLVFEELDEEPSEDLLYSLADSFLLDWKETVELDPDGNLNAGWEVSVKGELGLRTSKIVVITLAVNSYAGGVHPNSFITIFNFDLKTGKLMQWEDIITDLDSLKTLASEKFMAVHALPPGSDLNEAGYFWDGPFELPDNFEIQKDGIFFWYNPYEAASYAEGPTDFIITFKELGALFKTKNVF